MAGPGYLLLNDAQLRHHLLHAHVPLSLIFAKGGIVKVHFLQSQEVLPVLPPDLSPCARKDEITLNTILPYKGKRLYLYILSKLRCN